MSNSPDVSDIKKINETTADNIGEFTKAATEKGSIYTHDIHIVEKLDDIKKLLIELLSKNNIKSAGSTINIPKTGDNIGVPDEIESLALLMFNKNWGLT